MAHDDTSKERFQRAVEDATVAAEKRKGEGYRLMIYFAVATLHFYRDSIEGVRCSPQPPEEFKKRNADVIQRVRKEALDFFKYELNQEQINRAVMAYLAEGHWVKEARLPTVP